MGRLPVSCPTVSMQPPLFLAPQLNAPHDLTNLSILHRPATLFCSADLASADLCALLACTRSTALSLHAPDTDLRHSCPDQPHLPHRTMYSLLLPLPQPVSPSCSCCRSAPPIPAAASSSPQHRRPLHPGLFPFASHRLPVPPSPPAGR